MGTRLGQQKTPHPLPGAGFCWSYSGGLSSYLDTRPQPAPPLVIRSTSTRARRRLVRSRSRPATVGGRIGSAMRSGLLRCDMQTNLTARPTGCQQFLLKMFESRVELGIRTSRWLDVLRTRCTCDTVVASISAMRVRASRAKVLAAAGFARPCAVSRVARCRVRRRLS